MRSTTSPTRWIRRAQRQAVKCAAVALAALCVPVAAQDAGVQWSGGRLSVQAGNQTIGAALKDIQRRTGIAVVSYDTLAEPVARGFERLPLTLGLKTLLSKHNHMIIEGSRRKPLRVYVLGGSARVLDLPGGNPSAAAGSVPAQLAALASTDAATRVEAVERLADLADAASLAAIRQALTDPMEAVRVVAQQALATRLAKPNP